MPKNKAKRSPMGGKPMQASRSRILIMGAAGRDFHNFNVRYRQDPASEVVAFTDTQIPNIEGRTYPAGIPIYPEAQLEQLIRDLKVQQVVFAYSDVTHEHVMHKASRVIVAGADFVLLGTQATVLRSVKPVISIRAVRTGSGKSQTSRRIAGILRELGHRVAAVRHPMPYGNLSQQALQRVESYKDLDLHEGRIEEREEDETHPARGGNGSRCGPVGRREQRPALLPERPASCGRRSASSGA